MKDYPLEDIFLVMKPGKIGKIGSKGYDARKEKLDSLLDDDDYVAEEKIDGCHYNIIENRFFSTHISKSSGFPVEKTENFPHLMAALNKYNRPLLLLDGEINYPGKKSQDATHVTGASPDKAVAYQEEHGYVYYTIWDVLRNERGQWLLDEKWANRRMLVHMVVDELNAICAELQIKAYFMASKAEYVNKREFLNNILDSGGEGIVLKRKDSIYQQGKRPMWVWMKWKMEMTDDVVIMGFEPPNRDYEGTNLEGWPYWLDCADGTIPVTQHYYENKIGSILIGKYSRTGELIAIGRVTGMSEEQRTEFTDNQVDYIGRVIKIKAMEKTNADNYRHASFLEMHPDKNAYECIMEGR